MNDLTVLMPQRGDSVLVDPSGNPISLGDEARDMSLKEFTEYYKMGTEISAGGGTGNAYRKHAAVYRCINTIANAQASLPIHIKREQDDDVVYGEPINDLFDRPAPRRSAYDLIFGMATQLEGTGNACVWMDFGMNGKVRPGHLPQNLVVLNSRMVKPVVYGDAELMGYEYRLKNGSVVKFTPEEIMHVMYYDPENPWWGQSVLEAAADSIYLDNLVQRFGVAFFENSAQMGGILIHKGSGELGKKVEGIRKEFEDRHVGINRAHRPAILSGNWEYHETGLTLQEMALLGLREFLREDIGSVFNVPNIYLNKEKGVSVATATVEARIFAETNWLPKARMLESAFRSQFFRRFAPNHYLRFDVSEAPGIREDLVDKINTFVQLADRGVWIGDIIRLLNIDLPIRPDYNTHLVPMGMVPAVDLLDGSGGFGDDDSGEPDGDEIDDDGTNADDDGTDPDVDDDNTSSDKTPKDEEEDDSDDAQGDGGGKKTKKKLVRRMDGLPSLRRLTGPKSLKERGESAVDSRDAVREVAARLRKKKAAAKPTKRAAEPVAQTRGIIDDPDRDFFWRKFVGSLDPIEKKFSSTMRDHFFALRKETLTRLHTVLGDSASAPQVRASASEIQAQIKRILFDLKSANSRLSRRSGPLHKAALQVGGNMMLAELEIDDSFDVSSSSALAYLQKRRNMLVGVNRTVWKHVRDQLRKGISEGESVGELADRLRGRVFNPSASRARTIARTETLTVVNRARWMVMEDEGIEEMEWLSARDEHVRQPPESQYNHAIDGQRRKMGKEFSNGLRFPLDEQGSRSEAGNIINCRCTTIPVV